MKAQVDGLPTQSRSAQEHLWLWYGSTLANDPWVLGRLDGRLIQPCCAFPFPILAGDCSASDWTQACAPPSALSLSHIRVLRHARHKLGLVQRHSKKDDTSAHHTKTTPNHKGPRGSILHLSASFVSASLTNFDAQHSRVRRIGKEVANLLASGQSSARKLLVSLSSTTPLHAHVVCV